MNIDELIGAGGKAITGRDKSADLVRGSDYESIIGPSAVIWTRQDRRDEALFNSTKFHTAQGEDLTYLVKQRFGIDRILDTNGSGQAVLSRPDNSGGPGTIWKGTRVLLLGDSPRYYKVKADTVVTTEVNVNVPIESITTGPGCAANANRDLRLEDILWDSSWTVSSLQCDDGTTFEQASDLIARVRKTRLDQRVGHVKAIETACKSVGASKVFVFRSNYTPVDGGLNVVYVGDAGYQGSPALVKACTIALRNARVLGDHMQVLPLARVTLNPVIDIYLDSAPALHDIERLQQIHRGALIRYLGGTSGGFAFTRIGILSSIARPTPEVQRVSVVTPSADVSVLVSNSLPAVLNRYVVGTIALRYHGP